MSRRSKFAIDFNQDKNTVARLVLTDLLRKHPRGASGKLGKNDYEWGRTPHKCYRDAASREKVGIWCGYTEDQIISLFIADDAPLAGRSNLLRAVEKVWYREQYPNKSEEEIECSYYYVPDATMTRRMDRIESRIRSVRNAVMEKGRAGIFKIELGYRSAYSDVSFYVWANSKSDARGQFETLTKPLIAAVDPRFSMEDHVNVKQDIKHFDLKQESLLEYSQITIDEMSSLEKELQSKIAELNARLEGLRGIKDMITDMAVQSITVGDN